MTVSVIPPIDAVAQAVPAASEFREPPREAWYCAKSRGRLAPGARESVTILGEQIVIGRKHSGEVFALRDRCPHRGAPLSQGPFDGLLPGQRIERITVGRRTIVNATFATPIDAKRTLLTNVLLSDLPQLALLALPLRWAARAFLRQDQDILELAQQGLERKPTMLLMGQADRLAQWYFRLKRDYAAARRTGVAFENTLAPERLRWRT
ncbi:Rieske [2Fe-2S] domain protein [Bosea sp. LC85]|uniref:Rieske (2Fe-2S) protein n=1 Tax=Bosea sp. LC85 TaxID=1502851 RepID=UPI0004E41AF4|nr:Rieske (2Fe-2S) protein [Bosea sp. LC85]KFC75603.1 Rieske [2Fe-2S] domain protein [Bosea sp. LC85]